VGNIGGNIRIFILKYERFFSGHGLSRSWGFVITLIFKHITFGRIPLDEGSARRRDLYLTTQALYKTNIHAPGGIRTYDSSTRTAADLRLRPRAHWDRHMRGFVYGISRKQFKAISVRATKEQMEDLSVRN
jgi:imidazolonepropionase-like amidohydrolase